MGQPLGLSAGLARACGGNLLLSTINCGKDPSTTPLTQGMLRPRFSAFWLDQPTSAFLLFAKCDFCQLFSFCERYSLFLLRDGCM